MERKAGITMVNNSRFVHAKEGGWKAMHIPLPLYEGGKGGNAVANEVSFSMSLLWDSESVAIKTERAEVFFTHSFTALRISARREIPGSGLPGSQSDLDDRGHRRLKVSLSTVTVLMTNGNFKNYNGNISFGLGDVDSGRGQDTPPIHLINLLQATAVGRLRPDTPTSSQRSQTQLR
ncbi:hypothetical protein INR49_000485 [Caranx melampygus]|nr:hypothetical protein INR49_000485 [Caranx melampygus]